jgi:23S rRNA (cytidine2498-2'-O)-methyltransferase
LLKTWRSPDGPFLDGEVLAQLRLATPEAGDLSVASSATEGWQRVLSPWPGGYTEIPRDLRPPSRAYRKLLEVERRWGRPIEPNETCVDLGAAPGGWTFLALERGARVTAVDRSPLRDDLMAHPQLTFAQGDAFRYRPDEPVDWLLADIIAFPDRPLELLEAWLGGGWCRHFVVTFKFRGEPTPEVLSALKHLLRERTARHGLRQLQENKNEVTAWGTV